MRFRKVQFEKNHVAFIFLTEAPSWLALSSLEEKHDFGPESDYR